MLGCPNEHSATSAGAEARRSGRVAYWNWEATRLPLPNVDERPSSLVAAELPEVLAARDRGWWLAPETPMWVFLPAVWPEQHRGWLVDRSSRYVEEYCTGQSPRRLPWSADDSATVERDLNTLLRECGLPARPPARLWFLRLPPGCVSLEELLVGLMDLANGAGVDACACHGFVSFTASRLREAFEAAPGA